jgi:MoaA/NifB/PqqE/SkfB family radical SAM enzyme
MNVDYRTILERARANNLLYSVLLELTYRCNWRCAFCYNDLQLTGTRISTEGYLTLLDRLRDMQVMEVVLSGGEATCHPDFFTIAAHARKRRFSIRLKTNGHSVDRSAAQRLVDEVQPRLIDVSIHGACAATHDRLTRVKGSFARLMTNLESMLDLGLRVNLNSVLTCWNEDEIERMYALADSLGLPLKIDPDVTPRDDGDLTPLKLSASDQGVAKLFEIVEARRKPAIATGHRGCSGSGGCEKHCGAGSQTIAIDPFGTVYPCVQWRERIGNIFETPIDVLWNSHAADQVRRENQDVRRFLDGLAAQDRPWRFCPGLAQAHTGNTRSLYPMAQAPTPAE